MNHAHEGFNCDNVEKGIAAEFSDTCKLMYMDWETFAQYEPKDDKYNTIAMLDEADQLFNEQPLYLGPKSKKAKGKYVV